MLIPVLTWPAQNAFSFDNSHFLQISVENMGNGEIELIIFQLVIAVQDGKVKLQLIYPNLSLTRKK